MSGKSNIQWTNRSWNPLTGCTRVTSGCDNCYAFALHDQRYRAYHDGKSMPQQYSQPFNEIQLIPQRLEDPLKIKKPQMFFVNSMSDLFHSKVPLEYIQQVFDTMHRADWHIFQILTKRAGRLQHIAPQLQWAPNIWMGTSIETDNLCARANALRTVPAAVRFLSLEPLLSPLPSLDLTNIDWVIVGGESGKYARSCNRNWVRDIRDLCIEKQVPFFFKQWGGRTAHEGGRILDGRTWDEMPHAYDVWRGK